MRFIVHVSSAGKLLGPALCVEADSWQRALEAARRLRGESDRLGGFSIEVMATGARAIDPSTRVVFDVMTAPAGTPLTAAPKGSPLRSPSSAPSSAPSTSSAPSPVASPSPVSPSRTSAPPPGVAAWPMMPEPTMQTMTTELHVLSRREEDPSQERPLTYRECAYGLGRGTSEDTAASLLRAQLEVVKASLAQAPAGKLVHLAAFEDPVVELTKSVPLATLMWKDWRGEPVITYPRRGEQPPAFSMPPANGAGANTGVAVMPPPPKLPHVVPAKVPAKVPSTPPVSAAVALAAAAPAPAPSRPAPPPENAAPAPVAPSMPVPAAPVAAAPIPAAPVPVPVPAAPVMQVTPPPAPVVQVAPPPPVFSPPPPPVLSAPPAPIGMGPLTAPPPPPGLSTFPPPSDPFAPTPSMPPPPPGLSTFPPPSSGRVHGTDLVADLFEVVHELHFLRDALEGAAFCLAMLHEKLPYRAGVVHFYDMPRREFVVAKTFGSDAEPLVLSRSATRDAMLAPAWRSRRGVVFAQGTAHPIVLSDRHAHLGPVKSVAVAAAMLANRPLAVLELFDPLDGEPFSASDGDAVAYVAEQYADFLSSRGVILDAKLIARANAAG